MGDPPLIKKQAFVKFERKDEEINKEQNNFSPANRTEKISSQQNNSYSVNQSDTRQPHQQPQVQGIEQQNPYNGQIIGRFTNTTTEVMQEPETLLQNTSTFEMLIFKSENKKVKKNTINQTIDQYGYFKNALVPNVHNSENYSAIKIARFIITQAKRIEINYTNESKEAICLDCKSVAREFQVMISMDDFEKRNIKRIIEKHTDISAFYTGVSDSRINNLLYNFIKDMSINEQYELKYKPGFYIDDNKFIFVSHNENDDLESSVIKNCNFDVKDFKYDEARIIVQEFCQLLNKKKAFTNSYTI